MFNNFDFIFETYFLSKFLGKKRDLDILQSYAKYFKNFMIYSIVYKYDYCSIFLTI